jgi:predicted ATP-dependent protease
MANNNSDSEVSNEETLKPRSYKTSGDIDVPDRIIDQIIGQKEAVETVKKAAKQRRNVLLIGEQVLENPCWPREWLNYSPQKNFRTYWYILT